MASIRTRTESEGASDGGPLRESALYAVFQADKPHGPVRRHSLSGLDEVRVGRGAELGQLRRGQDRSLTLTLPDAHASRAHFRLERHVDRWTLEDLGSRNGVRLWGESVKRVVLEEGDLFECGRTFFRYRHRDVRWPSGAADLELEGDSPLPTASPTLAAALDELQEVLATSVPLFISGPNGVGKTRLARTLRPRASAELLCAEVSTENGVARLTQAFEVAQKGTLLVDGLEHLTLELQTALLGRWERAAAACSLPRLVVTASEPPEALVAAGRLREDLYARISGHHFALPALVQRPDDVGLAISAVLRAVEGKDRVTFDSEAALTLLIHDWRLNLWELSACLSVVSGRAGDKKTTLMHLPPAVRASLSRLKQQRAPLHGEALIRREELAALLREHHGNVSAVARTLGKARSQVQRWLRRYGLAQPRR